MHLIIAEATQNFSDLLKHSVALVYIKSECRISQVAVWRYWTYEGISIPDWIQCFSLMGRRISIIPTWPWLTEGLLQAKCVLLEQYWDGARPFYSSGKEWNHMLNQPLILALTLCHQCCDVFYLWIVCKYVCLCVAICICVCIYMCVWRPVCKKRPNGFWEFHLILSTKQRFSFNTTLILEH